MTLHVSLYTVDPLYNGAFYFQKFLYLNLICFDKQDIFKIIWPFRAYQKDVIKDFGVVLSAVIKRADCRGVSNILL